ncbi:MAG: prepilin-type N-terminal cleavage/methylation domain-containing protein [Desulfobacterales bacterium]|nr:prepilin-type N-terminal cleavage/methylation domain-containing protein [Desulfobacterales bacterium]
MMNDSRRRAQCRAHGPSRCENGFTLLELLVVMLIVGLASAFVAPRLIDSMTGLSLKTEAKKIAASLRDARSRAASEKKTIRVTFSFEENALAVVHLMEKSADEGDPFQWEQDPPEEEEGAVKERPRVYRLPEGVMLVKTEEIEPLIEEERYHIDFHPAGNSSGGEVTLGIPGDERESRYTVRVDFITGSVKME